MQGTLGNKYDYLVLEETWIGGPDSSYVDDIFLIASFEDPREAIGLIGTLQHDEPIAKRSSNYRLAVYQRYAGEDFQVSK